MIKHFSGFIDFVREQGVVGLAVGLAIGTATTSTVREIVEGFINPIVNLIIGSEDSLRAATWTLEIGTRSATFEWGMVLSSLLTLLATALVIYWFVHILELDKVDRKKDK